MKGLTLSQPHATLMSVGAKRIETRSWSQGTYIGPMAIHSGSRFPEANRGLIYQEPFRTVLAGLPLDAMPLGVIMAVGFLEDVVPVEMVLRRLSKQERAFGDYTPGRHAWIFRDVVALREPIPFKGMLNMWVVPAKTKAAILAQLTKAQIAKLEVAR
ncbi:MAG: 2-oxoglutarate dehydrogenase [Pedosphaera sp.]|nr:2-oxoglutarate dehydrogenase [Pedosphaera sp.]